MDADEREICLYLKSYAGQFVSAVKIARHAGGKKRYHEDPDWAVPVMRRLLEKALIEADAAGHYRLRPTIQEEKKRLYVSPQIRRLLEASGKKFEGVSEVDKDDDELGI